MLRVWRLEERFATFSCARCGETGWTRDGSAKAPHPVKLAKARADAAEHQRSTEAERVRIAGWLWARRQPITERTPAGIYLHKRAYAGPIPETLDFLPTSDDYPPAMIAAFGLAHESEPGKIAAPINVRGVHLTKLTADGDKIAEPDGAKAKIMIGPSMGLPIVISPPNDLQGLAITEGIEDALTVAAETGLGVWAAGAANRMPALAAVIPEYIDAVTIYAHADEAGQRGALELALALEQRGIQVRTEGLP